MSEDRPPTRAIVLGPEDAEAAPLPLRTGEGGHVWIDEHGDLSTDTRVALSANATCALFGHGVVDALNRLPLEMGPLGEGRDVIVPQHALEDASRIFVEADRFTYGASYEFVAARAPGPPPVEIRMRIDNRDLQRSLARLQFLLSTASRQGHAVRLRL